MWKIKESKPPANTAEAATILFTPRRSTQGPPTHVVTGLSSAPQLDFSAVVPSHDSLRHDSVPCASTTSVGQHVTFSDLSSVDSDGMSIYLLGLINFTVINDFCFE